MPGVTTPVLWYATRATGVVALVLLTGTMVLGMLTAGRARSRSWPAFAQADLHKRISLLAVVFLTIHVITAVLDTYVDIGRAALVVPFASPYRPLWTGLGTVGVDLLVAVGVSSALRQRISARTWRGVHWLAYGSWPVAMAHSLGEGTDASTLWMDGVAAVCALAVTGALVWRVADHRRSRADALRSGAATRVVPRHPRPQADRRSPVLIASSSPATPGTAATSRALSVRPYPSTVRTADTTSRRN
ncbi:MAG: ferric reductase-like transmembrane domain-containing protein [Acidimicrobiales bacterium]